MNPEYDLFINQKLEVILLKKLQMHGKESTDKIPRNCHITIEDDPHDLILNADLVITFNSSTLLKVD